MKTSPFRMVFNRSMTTVERFLVAIIVVYGAVVTMRAPQFLTLATLSDLLRGGAGIAILAIGVMIVLVSGGIDVSFTAIAIVAGYSSVQLGRAFEYDGLVGLTVAAIVIGALLGSVNALLIHFFKLQTLIVTLATASVFHGVMALTLGMRTYTRADVPQSLIGFGEANLFTVQGDSRPYGFTMFLPVVAGVVALTWFLLYRTRIGRSVFALGSSPESASRIGVNLLATRAFIYMYVGSLSGLMGIVYFSRLAYINPAALVGTELSVIAIAVIGGAKLEGGEGTILGTMLGVVVWQLFQNTLIFLGLGSQYNGLFFGSVLIFLLCVIYRRQRQLNKRALVFTT